MRRLAAVFAATLIGGVFPAPAAADDGDKPRRSTEQPLEGFDADIAKGLKAHGVPGLGIAIVKDGKVILAKGYGVRTTGQTDPVTEKTLFAIGSVSKSFTAASIAMLVDEGKLKWDDPLASKLKDFRLPDAYLTQEVTLRDALSHRVGIARNELIWYGSPFDRDAILHKLRDVKPGAKFRTKFVYNNILYMAAGQVIPQVASKSWDDFVSERLFGPLKMTRANTSVKVLKNFADVATPHEKAKGVAKAVPWKDADNIGPAGSINASSADMAEYVKFQLARGKGPEKRLLKRDVFDEMHTPQMLIPGGTFFSPTPHLHAYGLGWMLTDYMGKKVVEHGGNIDGMSAQVGMLPEEKLGVVVLANLGGSLLPQAVMYEVFDRFLGEPASNRLEATGLLMGLSEFGVQRMSEPAESSRIKDTKPSLAIEKYAGKYEDNLHAPLTVKCEKEKLVLAFNGLTFDLEHWHFDTFRGTDRRGVLPRMLFTFALDSDGKAAEIGSKVFGDDLKLKRKTD